MISSIAKDFQRCLQPYMNLAELGKRLKAYKVTDATYHLVKQLAHLEPPSLTSAQIEKLEALRKRPFIVKDKSGNSFSR